MTPDELKELTDGLYIEDYANQANKELEKLAANEQLVLSYKAMLNNPDGKRVLWDILSFCKVFQNSMTGNSWTYFNLGQASVGQYIIAAINIGNSFDDVLGFQKLKPEK